MLLFLHGYLLDGSGSNVWTRHIVKALAESGETVHLCCQEPHPENYPFVSEAYVYPPQGKPRRLFRRPSPVAGSVTLHQPQLGETLPVYVRDHYEQYPNAVPMVELPTEALEAYLARNLSVLREITARYRFRHILSNHAVLISEAARQLSRECGVPYGVIPHGSALEYAVKRDVRLHAVAEGVFREASRIFLVSPELESRLQTLFPRLPDLRPRLRRLSVGVDTARFQVVPAGDRRSCVNQLLESVRKKPRGKTPQQKGELIARVQGGRALQAAFAESAGYEGKLPDSDLESQLTRVDWESDTVVLFVGRLIPAKGLQTLLTSLPHLISRLPRLRVLVVGHGPFREPAEGFFYGLRNGLGSLMEKVIAASTTDEADAFYLSGVLRHFAALKKKGQWESYLERGLRLSQETVLFTGYLEHEELAHLLPCADGIVVPSLVPEAGPMVLLEGAAAGCFPLGTYHAGMAANLDALGTALAPEERDLTRLSPDPEKAISDLVDKLPPALRLAPSRRDALSEASRSRFDWKYIAQSLSRALSPA